MSKGGLSLDLTESICEISCIGGLTNLPCSVLSIYDEKTDRRK